MSESMTGRQIADVLRKHIENERLEFTVASQAWCLDGQAMSQATLAAIYGNDLDVSRTRVQDALKRVGHELILEAKKELIEWMQVLETEHGKQAGSEALHHWLYCLERMNTSKEMHNAHQVIMKQWIWQVKRAIIGKGAAWQVCPIFYSREGGTGKSTSLLRMLTAVSDFTRHLNVDDLGEKFSGAMLANTYVAFLDEFAGAGKVEAGVLKAILSGRQIDQRGIMSESGIAAHNRMSVIATSNELPPHGMVDFTGARRFWSIHCSGESLELNAKRRKALENVWSAEIWACVHAEDPSPYEEAKDMHEFINKVREENLRSKTSIENFLQDSCQPADKAVYWPLKEFLSASRPYCAGSSQPPIKGAYGLISERLKSLGVEVVKTGNVYYLRGLELIPEKHA